MIVYPPWWRGGRWDIERLMNDLFTFADNVAAQDLSGVKVEPFSPHTQEREDWIKAGNGYLFVHRRGGRIDKTLAPVCDDTMTELASLTKSRDDSNELMAYVSDILSGFGEDGGIVHRSTPHRSGLSTTFMKVPGEVVGPQLIPELIRDDRYVTTTWAIDADLPRGLPDSREALGLDD